MIIINGPLWNSRDKELAKALSWSQEQGYNFGLKYVGALGNARSMSCAILKLILLPILSEFIIYICYWFGNQIGMQVVPDKATADLILELLNGNVPRCCGSYRDRHRQRCLHKSIQRVSDA